MKMGFGEFGYDGFAPQQESESFPRAQSMAGLWRLSQSRPKITGKGTETMPRDIFSEWNRTDNCVMMS